MKLITLIAVCLCLILLYPIGIRVYRQQTYKPMGFNVGSVMAKSHGYYYQSSQKYVQKVRRGK